MRRKLCLNKEKDQTEDSHLEKIESVNNREPDNIKDLPNIPTWIRKDRIHLPPELGRLGAIKLETYATSLRCRWPMAV